MWHYQLVEVHIAGTLAFLVLLRILCENISWCIHITRTFFCVPHDIRRGMSTVNRIVTNNTGTFVFVFCLLWGVAARVPAGWCLQYTEHRNAVLVCVCVDGYWAVDGEIDYWLVVCTTRKRGVLIPAHYNYGVTICRCIRIVTVSVCITPFFFFFTLVRLASFSKTS